MAFITVTGENKIAAKQGAGQVLSITHFVLANIAGLGSEPVNRIEAMPAAGNIMATLPVTSSGYVNGNQVVYSLVMDSSLGDYDFNWVGLKDADGVLIACTYTPLIQKRKTTGAIHGNNLTRNFLIAFSGITATTAIAVPAATWQIDFNARLHGIDERERLSNYDIYGHEAFLGTGWNVQRVGATTTYDVLPGIGYVGGIRIASAITQQVTVAGPPKSIWLDVSLQGDISDVSAVVDFIIDAGGHADYTDGLGFNHYVTKIATIAADGSVTDVRVTGGDWATVPYVQKVAGGVLTKSVAGGVDVVLTDAECEYGILKLIGALTGNINVIVKSSPTRKWTVQNATSGNFKLTVKTATGTGILVIQGQTDLVWIDGNNVVNELFGKRFSRVNLYNANTALTAYDAGALVLLAGNGLTMTLPLAASLPNGTAISFLGWGWSSSNTIQRSGADIMYPAGASNGINSFTIGYGDTISLVTDGISSWYMADGNATQKYSQSFKASFGTNTTQRLPSGLLKQTGKILTNATGDATLTLPEAFGTAIVSALGVSNATQGTYICNVASASVTQIVFKTTSLGANVASWVYWEATGY